MNPLDNIRIVLVGTLYSGNVGSICRAMANMGLRHLTLAAPRIVDDWSEGRRLAVHGHAVSVGDIFMTPPTPEAKPIVAFRRT